MAKVAKVILNYLQFVITFTDVRYCVKTVFAAGSTYEKSVVSTTPFSN